MGYNAEAVGNIVFKMPICKKEFLEIESILADLGIVADDFGTTDACSKCKAILVSFDSEYIRRLDARIISALNSICKITDVFKGEFTFIGEDDAHWRFKYKNGEWKKEKARIVYYPSKD